MGLLKLLHWIIWRTLYWAGYLLLCLAGWIREGYLLRITVTQEEEGA